jgi:hypothetical protein
MCFFRPFLDTCKKHCRPRASKIASAEVGTADEYHPNRLQYWCRFVQFGLAASLSRPGGNITGDSYLVGRPLSPGKSSSARPKSREKPWTARLAGRLERSRFGNRVILPLVSPVQFSKPQRSSKTATKTRTSGPVMHSGGRARERGDARNPGRLLKGGAAIICAARRRSGRALRDELSVQCGIALSGLAPRHVCGHAITLHADPRRPIRKKLRCILEG